MFVSIHIPKTAGTSLGEVFDYSSGRRVFWDYDPEYKFAAKLQPEVEEGLGFIKKYYKFIHGHFFYKKYEKVFPEAKFISCVRHPVDRIVSQYYHVAYEEKSGAWQAPLIRAGKMDAVEYAKSDRGIFEAMDIHLSGRPIEDYDFIFLTESLPQDLAIFSKMFDFQISVPVEQLNTGEARMAAVSAKKQNKGVSGIIKVTEEQRKKIFGLCPRDVEVFRIVKDIRDRRIKKQVG